MILKVIKNAAQCEYSNYTLLMYTSSIDTLIALSIFAMLWTKYTRHSRTRSESLNLSALYYAIMDIFLRSHLLIHFKSTTRILYS